MKKKASMKTFYISFLDLMPYSDSHSKKVFSEKSALDAAEEVKSSKVILVRTAGTSLKTTNPKDLSTIYDWEGSH